MQITFPIKCRKDKIGKTVQKISNCEKRRGQNLNQNVRRRQRGANPGDSLQQNVQDKLRTLVSKLHTWSQVSFNNVFCRLRFPPCVREVIENGMSSM